ncbi:hypothetical protein GCM10007147_03390 [Nocardiopsis kunsanensis]|uniref:Uncharacterized protein n=1 Tax=Nocardiopsis kunsanensis TaxID=141693 RepID=A0A919CEW1_9ACTN|nr:hypothetical protein GCM10007147_03390 [Nocardiopsis kunsanensis]
MSPNKESEVPKTCPAYPPEYRDQIIALAHSGRTPEDLATECEPSAQTIRTWTVKKGPPDGGPFDDLLLLCRDGGI